MNHLVCWEPEYLPLDFGQGLEIAEATPDHQTQVNQKQDEEYDVFLFHLFQDQLSEMVWPVEVRLGDADGVPAEEMRMGRQVTALVEIAPDTDGKILGIDAYQFERNQHNDCPSEDFPIDFQWFPFKRTVPDDAFQEIGVNDLPVLTSTSFSREK